MHYSRSLRIECKLFQRRRDAHVTPLAPWSKFSDDYTERVKQIYGWSKPKMFRGGVTHEGENTGEQFFICYDENSEAPVKTRLKYC